MSELGEVFADAIRSKWPPSINRISVPEFATVESWLLSGTYHWEQPAGAAQRLNLRGSGDALTSALASEVARFSCAAYESMLDATPPNGRSLGWLLVRHYYAAFYGAHALLRLGGGSLTFLTPQAVSKLNAVGGQYLGISPQMKKGLHHIRRDPNNPNIAVIEPVSSGAGGSHEDLWAMFLELLKELENTIILTQGQIGSAAVAVQVSKDLRANLCRQGKANGAWPSAFRNAVNYRHDYGVWYPYKLKRQRCDVIVDRMRRWMPDNPDGFEIDSGAKDLEIFADTCNVVSHLLTSVLRDISRRSSGRGKSFVDLVPFKFLRQSQIPV